MWGIPLLWRDTTDTGTKHYRLTGGRGEPETGPAARPGGEQRHTVRQGRHPVGDRPGLQTQPDQSSSPSIPQIKNQT